MNPSQIDAYIIHRSATLEAALAVIEANHHRCVIVLDESRRVVGTLSDGDVRRALLNRRLLSAPVESVMNLNFISLAPGEEAKAKDISKVDRIHIFPVVDSNNHLLDVVASD